MSKEYDLAFSEAEIANLQKIAFNQGVTVEELLKRLVSRFLDQTNNVDRSSRAKSNVCPIVAKKGPRK